MDIIKCTQIADYDGSTRKYYNAMDVRIIDVNIHDKSNLFHKHNIITEILFILDGDIEVLTNDGKEIQRCIVHAGNVIIFHPNELHCTKSITKARIIVFKYIKTNNDLIDLFRSDWN